jgi:uncharacterized membrane protein (TIGR02234 family)
MIERLTSKRTVLVLVLVSAAVLLVSGTREWVSGSVDDAVLGIAALHGKGSVVAPGALAAALVGLAAAVAVATSGRVARVIAAWATLLAAVLGGAVVIGVLTDPGGALGRLAVAGTARTGTVAAHGHSGLWAWVALVATLGVALGGLGALLGGRHWQGLSDRYDAPVTDQGSQKDAEPRRRPPPDSAWEQLSRGEDPTAGP